MSFQCPALKQWWCFCTALAFLGCGGDWWDGSCTFPELLQSKQAGYTEGAQHCVFRLQTLALNWQHVLAFSLLLWREQVMPLMFGNCKIIWRQLSPFWRHGWSSGMDWGGQSLFPRQRLPGSTMRGRSLSGTTWSSPWPWSSPSIWVDAAHCHLRGHLGEQIRLHSSAIRKDVICVIKACTSHK